MGLMVSKRNTWKYKCFPEIPQIHGFAMSLPRVTGDALVLMVSDIGVLDSWIHPWKKRNPNVKMVYF